MYQYGVDLFNNMVGPGKLLTKKEVVHLNNLF